MNLSSLENIGLTKNESATYSTLLRIGQSKTGKILSESKLNSGKIYEILQSLKDKGLVSEITKDGVKHFTAAPPDQLKHFIEQKKSVLESQEKEVERLIPQLAALRTALLPEKRIVTYTGFRGIITAAEEALSDSQEGEEILSLGISDINAWSQRYWKKWERMRAHKKIHARYILSEKGSIYADLQEAKNVDVKVLPANTPVGIDIYGKNKTLILHYQEPISCTLMYDEHTATTFRSYFELLWKMKDSQF